MATITRYSCATCGAWYDTQAKATACATRDAEIVASAPAQLKLKIFNTTITYNKQT